MQAYKNVCTPELTVEILQNDAGRVCTSKDKLQIEEKELFIQGK